MDRNLTPAEASLSFRCGWFAAAADNVLGRSHFDSMVRSQRWELTEEQLAAWHQEALAMGVPASAIEMPQGLRDFFSDPDVIQSMIEYQMACDKIRENQKMAASR